MNLCLPISLSMENPSIAFYSHFATWCITITSPLTHIYTSTVFLHLPMVSLHPTKTFQSPFTHVTSYPRSPHKPAISLFLLKNPCLPIYPLINGNHKPPFTHSTSLPGIFTYPRNLSRTMKNSQNSIHPC